MGSGIASAIGMRPRPMPTGMSGWGIGCDATAGGTKELMLGMASVGTVPGTGRST